MKILKKVIIIFIITLGILSIQTFASTGKINVSATRLRKEKNTSSEILTNIYENEEVEIIEELGEWVKIKYKKLTGYIKKEFVTIKEEKDEEKSDESDVQNDASEKKSEDTEKKNDDVKENISNYDKTSDNSQNTNEVSVLQSCSLRLIPNFMSKQLQEINQGTKVTIISQMNRWAQVTDGSITGWVLKTKLDIGESSQMVEPSDLDTTNTVTSNKTNTTNTANSSNTTKETNSTNTSVKKNNTTSNTVKANNTANESKTNNTTNQSSITSASKKGKVNVETANVRKEPKTSSKRTGFLDEGDIVTISEETEEWYKVEYEDIEGYVSKKLITIISEGAVTSRSLTEERKTETSTEKTNENDNSSVGNITNETVSAQGNEVVEYAKKYLGYAYVVGGKTPETGFDCSGFTRYVYKNFGYNLATVSYQQTSVGTEVTRENLKPGDLVLFYNDEKTKIGHTGIYVGNGDFIHAANPKRGVVYDNINISTYYNERFVTARRIVK